MAQGMVQEAPQANHFPSPLVTIIKLAMVPTAEVREYYVLNQQCAAFTSSYVIVVLFTVPPDSDIVASH